MGEKVTRLLISPRKRAAEHQGRCIFYYDYVRVWVCFLKHIESRRWICWNWWRAQGNQKKNAQRYPHHGQWRCRVVSSINGQTRLLSISQTWCSPPPTWRRTSETDTTESLCILIGFRDRLTSKRFEPTTLRYFALYKSNDMCSSTCAVSCAPCFACSPKMRRRHVQGSWNETMTTSSKESAAKQKRCATSEITINEKEKCRPIPTFILFLSFFFFLRRI